MAHSKKVTRRRFLQTAGAVAGSVALYKSLPSRAAVPMAGNGAGFSVNITSDPADPIASSPQGKWAMEYLRQALVAKGVAIRPQADLTITAAGEIRVTPLSSSSPTHEQFQITPVDGGRNLRASGSDPLGLVYALTELADRVQHAADVRTALTLPAPINEKPANRIRGIVRTFFSERDDKPWFYDREGWQKYLDMLVTHRFNRINLSFGLSYDFSNNLTDTYTFFMYPFFINVPGYNVRAMGKNGPLPAEEMQKNLDTLKFISDQAALRGLQFVLGIWTHNYIWNASPNATYTIDGLNAQTQAPYSRDAMKMLIDACPGITGILLRTHGESGIPEGSYDLWKIVMAGVTGHKNADGSPRPIELELHAKTMTQEMIDTAHTTNMPITMSCKHWAEHMGLPYAQSSIREQEMPKDRNATGLMALSSGTRSFLRYGIGDLLSKDRKYKVIHRVWPGTQRLLLWGDPAYAAENGRAGTFAGMDGIDYFEPMSFRGRGGSGLLVPPSPDRGSYADASLKPARDWEKYTYTFRLWGRLSYNPDAPAETWQRQLQAEFGKAAAPLETALANASRILPLWTTAHLPAAASDAYWPEVMYNMSLYDTGKAGPYNGETPTPKVFGAVTSIDPQMFASVNEYVDALLAGNAMAKITPVMLAAQFETWAREAQSNVGKAGAPSDTLPAAQRRWNIDISMLASLGQYFANKLRAGMLWQLFNLSGHEPARTAAVDAYKKARDAWAQLADTGKVYLPDLPFGSGIYMRKHWSVRLADIETDLAGLPTRQATTRGTYAPATIDKLIQSVQEARLPEKPAAARHTPPARFTPNSPLALQIEPAQTDATVRLLYRHVHQGQRYISVDMQKQGNGFTAQIPADYTNSPFPLAYYFEIRTGDKALMHPGFKENFLGTPYFTVQS